MSSRSLENTRGLNSTAKGAIKGLGIRFDQSKDQSQNVKDLLRGSSNQHNTSLSNPPKSKNLTPGSLPSGMGIVGNNFYPGSVEEYQRERAIMKLKSHYKKLDLDDEKNFNSLAIKGVSNFQMLNQPQPYPKQAHP